MIWQRFARHEVTDDELIAAACSAQIHDLIASLPEGYQTTVGERGYRFSGVEKQQLSLARTILRNPPVLLLDEATSALDNTTERAMSQALAQMATSRTVISIAHRLSTVRHADRIFVLDAPESWSNRAHMRNYPKRAVSMSVCSAPGNPHDTAHHSRRHHSLRRRRPE
ncbi:ATP-binding cassette domain-containing protein [Paracoccus sulfuroxidans]|uniref:ATP-binding cassette subfamily B protein n=1 Tax=Paracoccus sulfuroxidans TaxID=384678 RepID=A0A562NUS7_9RHOB|nr:ATP-binding cassette subfamily B protein [Paracoccus sulfuroxidans]